MTTREHQVPIILDVTAESPEAAAEWAVQALADAEVVGRSQFESAGVPTRMIESWWTLEKVAKPYDNNDNEHGVVVFQDDLDHLYDLLLAHYDHHVDDSTWRDAGDRERTERLLTYFNPNGRRCGSDLR